MDNWIDKEINWIRNVKMDALGAMGISYVVPGVRSAAAQQYGLNIYLMLLEEEKRRALKDRVETAHEARQRILKAAEQRIMRDDADDLFIVLVA